MLAQHFLVTAARDLHTEPKRLSQAASTVMQQLNWPGNVRQLENICRWLTVMAPGQEIQADDLPPELRHPRRQTAGSEEAPAGQASAEAMPQDWPTLLRQWADAELRAGRSDLLDEALPAFERTLIEAALANTRGHRIDAAKRLGWGRNTLTRKIKELQLDAHRDN